MLSCAIRVHSFCETAWARDMQHSGGRESNVLSGLLRVTSHNPLCLCSRVSHSDSLSQPGTELLVPS